MSSLSATTGGVGIAAAKALNAAWRKGSDTAFDAMKCLIADADSEELREAIEHLALLVVGLSSIAENRFEDFCFDEWIARQGDWLALAAYEAEFADSGDEDK